MPFELLQGISKIYWDIEAEDSSNAFKLKEAKAKYPDTYEQFIAKFAGTKIRRKFRVGKVTETGVEFYPDSGRDRMYLLPSSLLKGIYRLMQEHSTAAAGTEAAEEEKCEDVK